MTRSRFFLRFLCLGMAAAIPFACSNTPQRQALTLTITPSPAVAPGKGQVQFAASATYSQPPLSENPVAATWGVADSTGNLTAAVTISGSGLAQCVASGDYTVGAWIPQLATPPQAECESTTVYGNPCGDSLLRTVALTCP
jgi:hypothetical protein